MEISSSNSFPNFRVCYVTFIVSIGSFLLDASTGYASPAVPDINSHQNPFHLAKEYVSWFASICDTGALPGIILTAYAMNHYGRKLSIMINITIYAVGFLIIVISSSASVLLVGRFVTGMGMGALNLLVPVYVAEIAPAGIRGRLCACHSLGLSFGFLYIHSISFLLSWIWTATTLIAIPCLFIILMLYVPESPRWLLVHGYEDIAAHILQWLRCRDSSEELLEIRDKLESDKKSSRFSGWRDPRVYKPLGIIVMLIIGKAFGGPDYFAYYTVSFFADTKINYMNDLNQSVIISISSIFGNLASFFLIAYLGRRLILISSACLITICMFSLGLYFYLQKFQPEIVSSLFWLPLIMTTILIFIYNMSWAPVPILMMAELLPVQMQGLCGILAIAAMYMSQFVLAKLSGTLVTSTIFGYAGLFWLYAACNVMNAVFTYFFVPETRGKTLEDIERLYEVRVEEEIPKILTQS